jgi:nucleoside diphosphate kinase
MWMYLELMMMKMLIVDRIEVMKFYLLKINQCKVSKIVKQFTSVSIRARSYKGKSNSSEANTI